MTGETLAQGDRTLHRIQYRDGTRGSWIEEYRNLQGNARVLENAMVWDEAVVCGDAVVTGKAHVRGRARVEGNAEVSGEAKVGGKAIICENAKVWGRVSGNAVIAGNTVVEHGAVIIDPLHGVEIGIAGLAQTIQQRNGEVYQPVDEWSPTDWGCALAGEVGELCNFLKKRLRGQDIPDKAIADEIADVMICLLYTSPSPRDRQKSRMPSSA